jgi:hypothetical protein
MSARVTEAPRSGIWRMRDRWQHLLLAHGHAPPLRGERQRGLLPPHHPRPGDWLYEGADMGILVMRGRMMTDDFRLLERSKKWLKAIKHEFKSVAPGTQSAMGMSTAGDRWVQNDVRVRTAKSRNAKGHSGPLRPHFAVNYPAICTST